MEQAAADNAEEGAMMKPSTVIKPLHKIISEHKDVVKIVIQLNSIISTFKSDVQEVIESYGQYGHLWAKVSEQQTFDNLIQIFFILITTFPIHHLLAPVQFCACVSC